MIFEKVDELDVVGLIGFFYESPKKIIKTY
jgi:hypothetical protein